jgi:hypothetical protein
MHFLYQKDIRDLRWTPRNPLTLPGQVPSQCRVLKEKTWGGNIAGVQKGARSAFALLGAGPVHGEHSSLSVAIQLGCKSVTCKTQDCRLQQEDTNTNKPDPTSLTRS